VPATPWLAVLAASGIGSLRRMAARIRGLTLGPAGAVLGFLILGLNLGFAVRHWVAPAWRDAARFQALCLDMGKTAPPDYRVAGTWDDLLLYELSYELAGESRLPPWERIPGPPLPKGRMLGAAERARLDDVLRRASVLLLDRPRFAVFLAQDSLGTAQILEDGPEAFQRSGVSPPQIMEGWVAEFGSELVLERVLVITPPGRQVGGLVTLELHWHGEWSPGTFPKAENGRPAEALKVGTSVVDGSGRVCLDLTHWLAHGFAGLDQLGGRRFSEMLIFRMPSDLDPGDYGVEVAVYEPLSGDAAALDLGLGFFRQRRVGVRTAGIPPGVTPRSVRASSFRLQRPAVAQ
jgi:hypothetical protein